MKKLMKKNEKGFTLVEVIVVLVILAIMAAILIPSLVGYIDKARENTIVSETRSITVATQSLVSEAYGKYKNATISVAAGASAKTPSSAADNEVTDYAVGTDDIETLCEIDGLDGSGVLTVTVTNGKVTNLVYTSNSKTCTYNGSSYSVA